VTARFGYPVFLDLHGVFVLVVGGGPVGARKVAGLHAAGAEVRLVASVVSDSVDRAACVEIRERSFEEADFEGVRLVVTATGDRQTDATISALARKRSIWTNAADQPVDCDFILPAIATTGRVTAAISTDGASPALAKALRDRVAAMLTDDVAALADDLAAERADLKARGESTEDVDWTTKIERALGGTDAAT
jgi:siroheme synthase-like protein